jgi:hypothetical protein
MTGIFETNVDRGRLASMGVATEPRTWESV